MGHVGWCGQVGPKGLFHAVRLNDSKSGDIFEVKCSDAPLDGSKINHGFCSKSRCAILVTIFTLLHFIAKLRSFFGYYGKGNLQTHSLPYNDDCTFWL